MSSGVETLLAYIEKAHFILTYSEPVTGSLLFSLFSTIYMQSVITLLLVMTTNQIETIVPDVAPLMAKERQKRMHG